ncbi:probable pectate lyase 19 [Mangifera indica]|uniref:probable pectate lyase 19 n=1 Tax=Mangifera indica TaxID=29780 RepID=UPI001CFA15F6|nr:probable pectate lyase 19 [Mangifera indica]
MELTRLNLVFLISLASLIPRLSANIAEYDEVWRRRAEEARKATVESYHPDPLSVLNDLNMHFQNSSHEEASTRRGLFKLGTVFRSGMSHRRKGGECEATNPIDQCWRCREDWADNRQLLAKCVKGFGYKTTGGEGGPFYVVTDCADDDVQEPRPGTLRHAVIQNGPLWIIFARDMHIKLTQELIVTSNKTIDARGFDVHIAFGSGITIQYVQNVIIHGLHIHHIVPTSGGTIRDSVDHLGQRTASDGDGISIFGSCNIWLDHLSMSQCQDGLIDVIMGSTAVTISNSHFTKHNDVILLGASDSYSADTMMQVTIAFNHFGQGLIQRMPRCRLGFFHVVNNDYTHWLMYAIGGSKNPTIISQGNRFIAPPDPRAKSVTNRNYATYDEWKHWLWKSEDDLFMNGAYFNASGDPNAPLNFSEKELIKAQPGTMANLITRYAGALYCHIGQKC